MGWKMILNIQKNPKEPTSQVVFYVNNLSSLALKILYNDIWIFYFEKKNISKLKFF